MRLVIALALALLAAGCLGGQDEPTQTPAAVDAAADNATSTLVGPADANLTLEDEGPKLVEFSYSGSTPEGVCGPMGCNFVTPGTEDFHPIEHEGHATKLAVEVTYANVKPGMEFYIGVCIGNGEDEGSVACRDYTTGPSPLLVEFDLGDHVPGQQVALSAGALNGPSTATGLLILTSSTFDAKGTLTLAAGSH